MIYRVLLLVVASVCMLVVAGCNAPRQRSPWDGLYVITVSWPAGSQTEALADRTFERSDETDIQRGGLDNPWAGQYVEIHYGVVGGAVGFSRRLATREDWDRLKDVPLSALLQHAPSDVRKNYD